MLLTYEEFLKLVPAHTSSFVIRALPVLDCYVKKNSVQMVLNDGNTELIKGEYSIPLTVLFHTYYHMNSKYATILTKYGYIDEKLVLYEQTTLTKEITLEKLFQDYGKFFCIYQNIYNYQALTPTAIIENIIQKNSSYNPYKSDYEYHLNADKLFSEKFSKFHHTLEQFRKDEANEIIDEIRNEFTQNLPIEIINYFETTSKIHQMLNQTTDLPSYIKSTEDIQVISLFLSFFHSIGTTEIKLYLNHLGLNEENIEGKYFEKTFQKEEVDYLLLNFYYTKFRKQSFKEILKLLRDREFTQSFVLEQVFKEENLDIAILTIPIEEVLKQIKNQQFLDSLTPEVQNFLESTTKTYSLLQKHLTNTTNYNIDLIMGKEDIILLSILLSLFEESKEHYYFLEKNGISRETLSYFFVLNSTLFQNKDKEKLNNQILTNILLPSLKEKENLTIDDILRIFLPKSNLLKQIMHALGKNYSILESEITTGIEQVPSLKERYDSLKTLEVPSIEISDIKSIVYFGKGLVDHSEFINTETMKLEESREIDKSSELILEITNQKNSLKKTLFSFKSKLLHLLQKQSSFSLIEHNQNLERTINKCMNTLQEEIIKYDQILQYLILYHQKSNEHLIKVTEAIKLKKEKETQSENVQDFISLASNSSYSNLLEDKKNLLETSLNFINVEIARINGAMINHSLSLTALTIAKLDLLPLTNVELTLAKSTRNDELAKNIYENILNFCQNLYNQNVEGINTSMEIFRANINNENSFNRIERDVNNYLKQLQNKNVLEEDISRRQLLPQNT